MSFDWQQDSKERYFRKAEERIEAAGFGDILQINKDGFATVKGNVKVFFKPIKREGNTRRWWEAKRTFEGVEENTAGSDEYGRKRKTLFIHGYMILEMEEQDK